MRYSHSERGPVVETLHGVEVADPAYSPLPALRAGTSYPATLILTGDHGDRAAPAHSYKFGAELQHDQAGDAPVLLRIEKAAGHGFGKPKRMVVADYADMLAFAAENTGLTPG